MAKPLRITLQAARVNRNMTREQAAKLIGVTPRTLANWEDGKTAPKSTYLYRLSELYDIPLDNIFLPGGCA